MSDFISNLRYIQKIRRRRTLTGQQRYEVTLQHWLEEGVDVSVLVVAHRGQQLLNKVDLIGFVPLHEVGETRFAFGLEGG